MAAMDFRIIEGWFRRLSTWWDSAEHFLICFQQSIDYFNDLASNTAKHPDFGSVGSGALIVAAFERDKPLVEFCPFRIQPNGIGHHQKHRLLHGANASMGETGMIKRFPALAHPGCPAEVRFECCCM